MKRARTTGTTTSTASSSARSNSQPDEEDEPSHRLSTRRPRSQSPEDDDRSEPRAAAESELLCRFEFKVSRSSNLRVLGSAFQCLAKIGKEVVLDADAVTGTVALRALNPAQTAQAEFCFHRDFFEHLHFFSPLQGEGTENADANVFMGVKIPLKSCLIALRTLRASEYLALRLVQQTNSEGATRHVVVFDTFSRNGVLKTHQFYYEDSPSTAAEFDRDLAKHRIQAHPSCLIEAMKHFRRAFDFRLTAHRDRDVVLSSTNRSTKSDSDLRTEMCIPASFFTRFEIAEEVARLQVTSHELQSVLAFCESNEIPNVTLLFNEPESPMLLASTSGTGMQQQDHRDEFMPHEDEITASSSFSFSLVLATMALPTDEGDSQALSGEATATS